jgi:hypothetical protein
MLTSKAFVSAALVLGTGLLVQRVDGHDPDPAKPRRAAAVSQAAPNPFAEIKRAETIVFKGCAVTFIYDDNGGVVKVFNDPKFSTGGFHSNCSEVVVSEASALSLNIEGIGDLGLGQFGDGYFSSGSNSCTTRVIGGNLYTWGSPCP